LEIKQTLLAKTLVFLVEQIRINNLGCLQIPIKALGDCLGTLQILLKIQVFSAAIPIREIKGCLAQILTKVKDYSTQLINRLLVQTKTRINNSNNNNN